MAALDVHHVVNRSQGGSDLDLDQLVALCRWCHDQTDAPYERGRLVVTALGEGQFTFEVVQRAGRGTPQASGDGQFSFDVIKRTARESAEPAFCPRGHNDDGC